MCTLALYYRKFQDYPLVIAANRDEHFSRPSAPPQVLLDEPKVFGGKDLVAGGTWLGVNAHGLIAAVVNRRAETQKAVTAPRSRGLLCLDMLRAKDASQAGAQLKAEHGSSYQPFILLVASAESAFVAYNDDEIRQIELKPGLHVFSNRSFCDSGTEKLERAYQLFSNAAAPLGQYFAASPLKTGVIAPERSPSPVSLLQRILSDHELPASSTDPRDAICVHTVDYGTVSSSIIFQAALERRFYFYHAPSAPCSGHYETAQSLEVL